MGPRARWWLALALLAGVSGVRVEERVLTLQERPETGGEGRERGCCYVLARRYYYDIKTNNGWVPSRRVVYYNLF
eukprot:1327890-Amorphochlora_amoeboformis.AAC.1